MTDAMPAGDRLARRQWLRAGAGAALAALAGRGAGMGVPADAFEIDDPQGEAAGVGYRFGGEFEPLAAVWLSYDAGHAAMSVGLAAALAPHVPLRFVVRDAQAETDARQVLLAQGVPLDGPRGKPAQFVHEPLASYFLRDMAVFTRAPGGRLGVADFRWTQYGVPAWCAKRWRGDPGAVVACSANADYSREELAQALAQHAGARLHRSSVALEGGGFETNGRGLLIANEAYLRSRNPGVPRAVLERALLRLPGLRKVIWLPEGLAEDPHLRATITGPYVAWGTGGHTDLFVRFADARTVLLAWPEDGDVAAHPVARMSRARMQRNLAILGRATDAEGRPLRVLKVPMPRPLQRRVVLSEGANTALSEAWSPDFFAPAEGRRPGQALVQMASASYLNFVPANGVIVLPDYEPHGTPPHRQLKVRRIFERAFPQREVRFVDAITANWVGGGPHCATLSEPA
ncbi:MAG: agmatine deiminase family protein [Burkholderiales bacterium]|nr:agmatine deiminase family protein [Burkholderiales bacterium]